MARKTPKINVLLSISKTPFFKTSEIILEANYGTRKRDYFSDSSYFELKTAVWKDFRKEGVFGLGTLRQAARQNFSPFKFTHFPPFKWFFQCVLFIGFQIWLERRSSRIFCFYSWAEVTIRRKRRRWASYFLAPGPWIHQPMIHDGTELKKLIPAWGA